MALYYIKATPIMKLLHAAHNKTGRLKMEREGEKGWGGGGVEMGINKWPCWWWNMDHHRCYVYATWLQSEQRWQKTANVSDSADLPKIIGWTCILSRMERWQTKVTVMMDGATHTHTHQVKGTHTFYKQIKPNNTTYIYFHIARTTQRMNRYKNICVWV